MNKTRVIIFILLLTIVFAGIIYAQTAQGSRERWEYMGVVNRMTNVTSAMADFNELGRDGWELVMVNGNTHIFKRRLP